MLDLFQPGRSLAWDLTWQATAFLAAGGAASLLAARRPARAHRALLLAMIAGLVTPLLGQGVRHLGLGLIAPESSADAVAPSAAVATASRPRATAAPRPWTATGLAPPVPLARASSAPPAAQIEPAASHRQPFDRDAITSLAIRAWVVLALASALRLAVSLALGVRVVARARAVDDPAIHRAAGAARARLGLAARPEVLASDRLRCPVVWCWGRRPTLILPEDALREGDAVDWVAVLTHELAHWGRRDHLAALVGEVFACALPWHPLAWWAKGRMGQCAELACDDWVLASGQPAAEYAETLLGLVPQARSPLALAAVSTRGGLVGRVVRILDDVRREPSPGARWTALAMAATALAASVTALAQSRPAVALKAEGRPAAIQAAAPGGAPEQVASGRVLMPDGRPAAGAVVEWVTYISRTKLSGVALPKQSREVREGEGSLRALGRATADAEGRFRIAARYDPEQVPDTELAARAPGAALCGRYLWKNAPAKDLTLKLAPAVRVEGRLLTPSGGPASGVAVDLAGFDNGGEDQATFEGLRVDPRRPESERPGFWPRTMTTDASGRFVLDRVVPAGAFAELHFRHPDFADDEVTVSTGPAPTAGHRAFDIRPVKPRFTHALAPARPVQGAVTAKDTGRPIAGATVELIPMRRHGGMSFFTTTDDRGRYRVAGHQAESYYVNVFPPLGSPYLDGKNERRGWPAGAKVLTMDFTLDRGTLFRGTVVDAETRAPIAGASLVYQPKRGNPNNRGGHELRNPVLTDAGGRFAIAGLPGAGYLLVEEGSLEYVRGTVPGKDTGVFGWTLYPHGFAKVDARAGAEPAPVEVALHKGKTLEARAVRPDGRPVPSIEAWCPELTYRQLQNWRNSHPFEEGLFKLSGADPSRTYRVFFLQKDLKLAAVAKLKLDPKAAGPIEVRLQPMATVKGVAVNKDGTTAKGVQVSPIVVLTEDERPLKEEDFVNQDRADFYNNLVQDGYSTPTTPAEFAYANLIPGLRYYVGIYRNGWTYQEVRAPKPGEVIDLGKVTVEDKR
jgi:beta-lactamase regulating signal transducer with metallopeptidase domain